jgi:hypothetical protein
MVFKLNLSVLSEADEMVFEVLMLVKKYMVVFWVAKLCVL